MLLTVSGATDILLLVLGWSVVGTVVGSAARTVVLPDGHGHRAWRALTFAVAKWTGRALSSAVRSPRRKHLILSGVPAFALLSMPVVWLTGHSSGSHSCSRRSEPATGARPTRRLDRACSPSGFSNLETIPAVTAEFLAAAVSISILALLVVTYLPTMYGVYSRREAITTEFETYAGTPPEAAEMLVRYHRLADSTHLDRIWMDWTRWFDRDP